MSSIEPWSNVALLLGEKNAIGFYITGHPLDNYVDVLNELNCLNALGLSSLGQEAQVRSGGIITSLQARTTKKGDQFALFRLEDQTGSVKCVAWPEVYKRFKHLIGDDMAVLIIGRYIVEDDSGGSIIVDEVKKLEDVLQRSARAVLLRLPARQSEEAIVQSLFSVLDRFRGDCDVFIEMYLEGGVLVRSRPHGALRVEGSLEMEAAVRELGCGIEWIAGESFSSSGV